MKGLGCVIAGILLSSATVAGEIRTNSATVLATPSWLSENRVDRIIERVQFSMEWDIRRIIVHWYADEAAFQKAHGYDGSVLAVSRKKDQTIHLGPRVNRDNFDWVFGHELVHIVLYQKYKDAVPQWLDEGLANYIGKKGKVDYQWLASQSRVPVRSLTHPFLNAATSSKYHYAASTAAVEMIASKCSLTQLLQLSVGVGLEKYLGTFCGIQDLDAEFGKWIKRRKGR